jgi:hypothetical protein
VNLRLDSTGLRVVPLRPRADAPAAARAARDADTSEAAESGPAVADVSGARDLVQAVADAVRGRPQVAGMLHGTQRAAALSLLA